MFYNRLERAPLTSHFIPPSGMISVITGASGFPFVNFVAFMYTASRILALEKKGSFRELLTTSAHMLLYFRYDMPAMRQYACWTE